MHPIVLSAVKFMLSHIVQCGRRLIGSGVDGHICTVVRSIGRNPSHSTHVIREVSTGLQKQYTFQEQLASQRLIRGSLLVSSYLGNGRVGCAEDRNGALTAHHGSIFLALKTVLRILQEQSKISSQSLHTLYGNGDYNNIPDGHCWAPSGLHLQRDLRRFRS